MKWSLLQSSPLCYEIELKNGTTKQQVSTCEHYSFEIV